MWVRGLKLQGRNITLLKIASHPMWVRGLKLLQSVNNKRAKNVAPHVGAWIETQLREAETALADVAPHVGAWIET